MKLWQMYRKEGTLGFEEKKKCEIKISACSGDGSPNPHPDFFDGTPLGRPRVLLMLNRSCLDSKTLVTWHRINTQ